MAPGFPDCVSCVPAYGYPERGFSKFDDLDSIVHSGHEDKYLIDTITVYSRKVWELAFTRFLHSEGGC
jgi:hypothetical protein